MQVTEEYATIYHEKRWTRGWWKKALHELIDQAVPGIMQLLCSSRMNQLTTQLTTFEVMINAQRRECEFTWHQDEPARAGPSGQTSSNQAGGAGSYEPAHHWNCVGPHKIECVAIGKIGPEITEVTNKISMGAKGRIALIRFK